jgi:hypothetical protein
MKEPWEMTSAEYNDPFNQNRLSLDDIEALKKIRDTENNYEYVSSTATGVGVSEKHLLELREKGLVDKHCLFLTLAGRRSLLLEKGGSIGSLSIKDFSALPPTHEYFVRMAVLQGKDVPTHVLSEYPDLCQEFESQPG